MKTAEGGEHSEWCDFAVVPWNLVGLVTLLASFGLRRARPLPSVIGSGEWPFRIHHFAVIAFTLSRVRVLTCVVMLPLYVQVEGGIAKNHLVPVAAAVFFEKELM